MAIAIAATEIFWRRGYRGTRTADVAAGAGMSAGSLFTYVESKEAMFHLVFLHGLGLLPDRPDDSIIRQAALLGDAFDRVLLYEEPARFRGRAKGEMFGLLRRGLASGRPWPRMSRRTSHQSCAGSSRSGTT